MLLSPDVIFVFATASVALALAPGPDNIFVLTQSALYGRVAGLMVTLGLMTGVFVHTAFVAVGVAAIFQTSALAFTALKVVGAAYLIYLAVRAFRAGAQDLTSQKAPRRSLPKLYATGVVMNVTNPKVAIFFLALLPQFTDPARGSVPAQIVMLGCIFILCATVIFAGVAWVAGFLGNWLAQSPRAQVMLNRIAGVVFLGLAARLVVATR